jgi:hypothetical protein
MEALDALTSAIEEQALGDDHELRAAAVHGDTRALRDRALERVILRGRQAGQAPLPPHQLETRPVSTFVAVSTSASGTNSDAACASAMSPGP